MVVFIHSILQKLRSALKNERGEANYFSTVVFIFIAVVLLAFIIDLFGISLWPTYLLTVFSVVAGFAVYDILYRRVPDRALAFFMPFAALAPLLKVCFIGDCGQLWPAVAEALAGALLGFCIPLAAAMATGGTGLGGGDIKFCGILGLIYGPSGMALVFFVAAVFAMPMVLLFRRLSRPRQPIAIPFLPFLACGCSIATLAELFL